MAEQSATKMARKTVSEKPQEISAETTPSITEDLECDLDALDVDQIRGVCERLREESRRRTVALASAVHELRTPLAVMEGYMELLFSGKAGIKVLPDPVPDVIKRSATWRNRWSAFIDLGVEPSKIGYYYHKGWI